MSPRVDVDFLEDLDTFERDDRVEDVDVVADTPPMRRAPRVFVNAGRSPWESLPRENFTAVMSKRVPIMTSTRQSRMVRGQVNW